MNILGKYTLKVSGIPYVDMKKVVEETHPYFEIIRKGTGIYFLENTDTGRLYNLKCIIESYTLNKDCTKMNVSKNKSMACYQCKKYFDLDQSYPNCRECHKEMIKRFDEGKINIIRK